MAAVVVSSPELEPSSVQPMGKALLFQPRKDQDSLQQPLGNIPRYLFRLYAPRSAGVTNSNAVVSPEAASKPGSEPGTDLLQLPRQRAANMLWGHLNWKRPVGDNLMSWTSSLLFALQHGLRRAKKDYDEPTLSDIQLCVVDTRDFPRGTFIKDLDVMKAYSDFPNIRSFLEFRQGNDYYYGEYLSQGRLEIADRAQHTSLSTMIDLGLYDIEPELQYEHEILCKRINTLRNAFAAPNNAACPLSKKEARKAIMVAQGCFGDRFALPFAAMLLSLRRRREMDPVILDAFAAMFTDEEICALSLRDLKVVDGERLPEVQQFERIIQDISRTLAPVPRRASKKAPTRIVGYPDLSGALDSTGSTRLEEVVISLKNLTVSQ